MLVGERWMLWHDTITGWELSPLMAFPSMTVFSILALGKNFREALLSKMTCNMCRRGSLNLFKLSSVLDKHQTEKEWKEEVHQTKTINSAFQWNFSDYLVRKKQQSYMLTVFAYVCPSKLQLKCWPPTGPAISARLIHTVSRDKSWPVRTVSANRAAMFEGQLRGSNPWVKPTLLGYKTWCIRRVVEVICWRLEGGRWLVSSAVEVQLEERRTRQTNVTGQSKQYGRFAMPKDAGNFRETRGQGMNQKQAGSWENLPKLSPLSKWQWLKNAVRVFHVLWHQIEDCHPRAIPENCYSSV